MCTCLCVFKSKIYISSISSFRFFSEFSNWCFFFLFRRFQTQSSTFQQQLFLFCWKVKFCVFLISCTILSLLCLFFCLLISTEPNIVSQISTKHCAKMGEVDDFSSYDFDDYFFVSWWWEMLWSCRLLVKRGDSRNLKVLAFFLEKGTFRNDATTTGEQPRDYFFVVFSFVCVQNRERGRVF